MKRWWRTEWLVLAKEPGSARWEGRVVVSTSYAAAMAEAARIAAEAVGTDTQVRRAVRPKGRRQW